MGIRIKTPALSFSSFILYTTRMVQLASLPPVQYKSPIPPCPRISPFSTLMEPGPTCFQPVRSLPLKSSRQAVSGDVAAAECAVRLSPDEDEVPEGAEPAKLHDSAAKQKVRILPVRNSAIFFFMINPIKIFNNTH